MRTAQESKDVALEFFNKNKASLDAMYQNDFDKWMDDIFTNGKKMNPAHFEAHHIIPCKILEQNDKLKQLLFDLKGKADFDFNGIDNGMMVQKKNIFVDGNGHGVHKQYSDAISEKITQVISEADGNKLLALKNVKQLIKDTKKVLKEEVLLGTKNVNDIVNF
jgi:hypothetical protein